MSLVNTSLNVCEVIGLFLFNFIASFYERDGQQKYNKRIPVRGKTASKQTTGSEDTLT